MRAFTPGDIVSLAFHDAEAVGIVALENTMGVKALATSPVPLP